MRSRNIWQIQTAVLYALFIREIQTRFGNFRLGIFWAFLEPISHILVLTILFTLLRGRDGFYGIPFALFFAAGVISFFIFQKTVLNSISSIKVNMGLFAYRQVKPLDTIIVRAFLELFVLITVAVFLIWLGSWVFGFEAFPDNLLKALTIILLIFILALGTSFCTAVIGVKYPESSQLIGMLMRPLYFTSGVFFPLEFIPQNLHVYLLWNPMLHGLEQFRSACFNTYPSYSTSLIYLSAWSITVFLLGLAYYRKNRINVLTS